MTSARLYGYSGRARALKSKGVECHDQDSYYLASLDNFFVKWTKETRLTHEEVLRIVEQFFDGIDVSIREFEWRDGQLGILVELNRLPRTKIVFCGENPDTIEPRLQEIRIQIGDDHFHADAMFLSPTARALAIGLSVRVAEEMDFRADEARRKSMAAIEASLPRLEAGTKRIWRWDDEGEHIDGICGWLNCEHGSDCRECRRRYVSRRACYGGVSIQDARRGVVAHYVDAPLPGLCECLNGPENGSTPVDDRLRAEGWMTTSEGLWVCPDHRAEVLA